MRERNYFGSMMVELGEAMLLFLGLLEIIQTPLNLFLEVIGKRDDVKKVLGMYIMNTKKGNLFLADTTVNAHPTEDDIVEITELVSNAIKSLRIKPRIALLKLFKFWIKSNSRFR